MSDDENRPPAPQPHGDTEAIDEASGGSLLPYFGQLAARDAREGHALATAEHLGASAEDLAVPLHLFARERGAVGFVVLGPWALRIAATHVGSAAAVQRWGRGQGRATPALVINESLFRDVVRAALLHAGVGVTLHERRAPAGPGGGGALQWQPARRGTPGNLGGFEAMLFDDAEGAEATAEATAAATGVLFIRRHPGASEGGHQYAFAVGVATLTPSLRRIGVAEFSDTEALLHADAAVAQLGLRELVVADSLEGEIPPAFAAIARLVQRAPSTCLRTAPKAAFTSDAGAVAGRLAPLLSAHLASAAGDHGASRVEFELTSRPDAARAVAALLAHARLEAGGGAPGAYALRPVDTGSLLRLDAAAVRALDVVAVGAPEAPRGEPPRSLFGWLNRCVTAMGSRLLREWLLQPLRCPAAARERSGAVQAFVDAPALRERLRRDVLRHCADLDRLGRRLQRGAASLRDVKALRAVIDAVPAVAALIREAAAAESAEALGMSGAAVGGSPVGAGTASPAVSGAMKHLLDDFGAPLEDINEHLGNLSLMLQATLEETDGAVVINRAFDDALGALAARRDALRAEMNLEHRAVQMQYGWTERQLKLDTHPQFGHCFRVGRKDDKPVRDHPRAFKIFSTSREGVRFTGERLSALSRGARDALQEYEERQGALKAKLMDSVATYLPVLDDVKELLARLDVLAAWAEVAATSRMPMVRPTLLAPPVHGEPPAMVKAEGAAGASAGGHVLRLVAARHPLIEAARGDFVPNTIELGATAAGGSSAPAPRAWVVTGPNMGGKSTLMRSAAVAVVLAQAGCFVPAEEATLTMRDAVLCRVGATDYMSAGLSTFMVEMLESAAILATATPSSLVVVDELGRGTSTSDGFGLAWAICDQLANNQRALTLFATHFHEMTAIADARPGVIGNVHVSAAVVEAGGSGASADEDCPAGAALAFDYAVAPGPSKRSYGVNVAAMSGVPPAIVADAAAEVERLEAATVAVQRLAAASAGAAADAATPLSAARGAAQRIASRVAAAVNEQDLEVIRAEISACPTLSAALGGMK